MKRTFSYLKPYSGMVVWGLVFKFAGSVAELFLPLILDYLIDEVAPAQNITLLIILGVAMLVFSLVALFGNIIANRFVAISTGKMTRDLRYDLFTKTTYLKNRQVDGFTLPSLVSRLTSDTYYVNQAFARCLRLGVRAPILLIGGLAMTFILDWRLALVLLACIPVVTVATVIITKKSVPAYTRVQKSGDAVVRAMQENISGVRVIKALSKTEFEADKFDGVNDNLTKDEFASNKLTALTNPFATLVLSLGLVGVIVAGAYLGAQAGTVLAFLSFFTIILNAMLGISKIFVTLSRGIASAGRIEEVLAEDERTEVKEMPEGNPDYKIEFAGVNFSYDGVENNLEDISFAVKAGQTVGVIGGTGSGKSTLINLLLRFYDADGGAIYCDGKDVRSLPTDGLRKKFGVVFQNDFLLSASVRENIDYFRGLPQEDIDRAVKCSCSDEFICRLEGGTDYLLAQKGANLSGGQKQRILVARALAGNPDVLVLDDSSSALDYATEARLKDNLTKYYPDCTKVVIAQRASSVKAADLIVVLDDGRIVGKGTHDQLIESCEIYKQICLVQAGGDL